MISVSLLEWPLNVMFRCAMSLHDVPHARLSVHVGGSACRRGTDIIAIRFGCLMVIGIAFEQRWKLVDCLGNLEY